MSCAGNTRGRVVIGLTTHGYLPMTKYSSQLANLFLSFVSVFVFILLILVPIRFSMSHYVLCSQLTIQYVVFLLLINFLYW